jgi:hypothetical protein
MFQGHSHQECPEEDYDAGILICICICICICGGYRCTKKKQQQRKQLTISQVPTGHNTASKLTMPGKTCVTVAATAEAHNPEASMANSQIANSVEPVPNNCSTDGKMVTLITTVQHFMRELQSGKMENNHFAIIM